MPFVAVLSNSVPRVAKYNQLEHLSNSKESGISMLLMKGKIDCTKLHVWPAKLGDILEM